MTPRRFSVRLLLRLFAILVVICLICAPYLSMVLTSLQSSQDIASIPAKLWPSEFVWSNYWYLWTKAPIARYLLSSLVVALGSTLLALLVALPAAYYVARIPFRGRQGYLVVILLAQMLAPAAVVVGLYREMSVLSLLDSWTGLILINAAFNLSFTVWLLQGFIASVPVSIEEAAHMDGASRIQVLVRILIPVIRPGLVTASIYAFIAAWNEFVIALTLISSERLKPLQVGITQFIGKDQVEWQFLFATSLIATVPVVFLFLVIRKNLVSGLTAGAVK